jgi:hypothetical protein
LREEIDVLRQRLLRLHSDLKEARLMSALQHLDLY